MKSSSAKAKGREAQKEMIQNILQKFPSLTEKDVFNRSMSSGGTDIIFSQKADKLLKIAPEVKHQKRLSIPKWWRQTTKNVEPGQTPVLFARMYRKPGKFYAILDADDFLELLKQKK